MVNQPTTYFEVLKWASSFLEEKNCEKYIAEYLLLEKKEWSKTDLLLHFKQEMPEKERAAYEEDISKIIAHQPVQYLIGSCEFYGRRFKVTEDTLIPRPETEELVDLIIKENRDNPKTVVDIGTGTGAIGLSLKLEVPTWNISCLDISKEALLVAKKNAKHLEASVDFLKSDVLSNWNKDQEIDIIVSNPPYISYNEWEEMDVSVREHEPKLALFAENNGLAIYEKIAKEAKEVLKKEGKIYLEIGYLQGEAVKNIFKEQFPDKHIEVIKDMNQMDRIIKVI